MHVPSPVSRRARVAVTVAFFVHGATAATWVSRIPVVKAQLHLSEAQLGLALLGLPVGAVVAVRGAGWAVGRWGSRRVVRASAAACVSVVLPALAWDTVSLLVALAVLGTSLGLLDVAMNAQGVAVERACRRPLMSGLHGAYSVGGLVGAGAGSLVGGAGVSPLVHFAGAAAALAVVGAAVFPWLLGGGGRVGGGGERDGPVPAPAWRDRALDTLRGFGAVGALAVIGLCSFVGEGAVGDWSGVYLREDALAAIGLTGFGFAGCSLAMAVGRLLGDAVVSRLGPVAVLRGGAALAAAGMAVALIVPLPWVAIAGFTAFGLGVAPVAPVTFSAAGNLPGAGPAAAISRVTSIGYLGLLGGPPAIGFLAQALGLRWALVLPTALVALILPLAAATRPRRP